MQARSFTTLFLITSLTALAGCNDTSSGGGDSGSKEDNLQDIQDDINLVDEDGNLTDGNDSDGVPEDRFSDIPAGIYSTSAEVTGTDVIAVTTTGEGFTVASEDGKDGKGGYIVSASLENGKLVSSSGSNQVFGAAEGALPLAMEKSGEGEYTFTTPHGDTRVLKSHDFGLVGYDLDTISGQWSSANDSMLTIEPLVVGDLGTSIGDLSLGTADGTCNLTGSLSNGGSEQSINYWSLNFSPSDDKTCTFNGFDFHPVGSGIGVVSAPNGWDDKARQFIIIGDTKDEYLSDGPLYPFMVRFERGGASSSDGTNEFPN